MKLYLQLHKLSIPAILLGLLMATTASAKVVTEVVEYKVGNVTCEGFLAYDDAVTGKRPGVLVIHQWMGLTEYERSRCEQLAGLGYVAFAADMYGAGVRPKNTDEAGAQAGKFKKDSPLTRERVGAAYDFMRKLELVDSSKTSAIGYCFGGWVCLELARSGKPVAGVVGFHCSLDAVNMDDAKNIKGRVLVLNGADDPFVPTESVAAFMKEMQGAGVWYEYVAYADAVHSFTHANAGTDKSKGAAYNADADKRSWEAMRSFFAEILK